MNRLQIVKRALVSYVNAVKFIWSELAYPLTIVGKKNMNLRDYKIFGNSIQDGTPTPEAPVEIQSVGELVTEGEYAGKYKIPVRARGKNILDMSKHTVELGYYSDSGGITLTNNNYMRISPIKVEPNTTYRFSSNLGIYSFRFAKTNGDHSSFYISGIWMGGAKASTFTTPDECYYVKISFYNTSGMTDTSAFQWAMLEKGKGDGIYEPYIEPQTFNIYLDEPLNYAENVGVTYANKYSDYIDFNTQTLQTETMKIILTGDEPWKARTNCTNAFNYSLGKIIDGGFCTHYPTLKSSAIDNQSSVYIFNTSVIIITDLNYDNVDDFKAFLKNEYEAGRPVTIICGLYDTQNEEYINLPELPQFKGTTIYEVDTNIEPSGMEVKYC